MREIDVVRAWKDEEYRASLTESERRSLPKNPAGRMSSKAMQTLPITAAFTWLTYYTYNITYYTVTLTR